MTPPYAVIRSNQNAIRSHQNASKSIQKHSKIHQRYVRKHQKTPVFLTKYCHNKDLNKIEPRINTDFHGFSPNGVAGKPAGGG